MEALAYLLKASAGLVVLYGIYWLFLRQHTYFSANRFYLLAALFVSLAAPLVQLPEVVVEVAATPTVRFELGAVTVAAQPETVDWPFVVWCIYAAGVGFMLLLLAKRLAELLWLIATNHWQSTGKYILVRAKNENISSFSFFNYLVLSHRDEGRCAEVILRHEAVHIRQWHSFDLLLVEVLRSFFWFNPVLILYKRSLQEVHEFIADELSTNGDRLAYARELVGYSFGVAPQALVNPFFNSSQLKNRIVMLTKIRSSCWVLGRYLLAIPVLMVLVSFVATRRSEPAVVSSTEAVVQKNDTKTATGFIYDKKTKQPLAGAIVVVIGTTVGASTDAKGAFKIDYEVGKELAVSFVGYETSVCSAETLKKVAKGEPMLIFLSKQPVELGEVVVVSSGKPTPAEDVPVKMPSTDAQPQPTKADEVFMVVEQQPEFKGGNNALYQFLGRNIKYPAAAVRANVEGKVFVQFVVDKNGETSDVTILKGIGFGCDEEAMRVVRLMPNWIPARQSGKNVAVQYTLPIAFAIEGKTASDSKSFRFGIEQKPGAELLIILDGVELESSNDPKIDLATILSVDVLKGEKAIEQYGQKGKNGVLIIKTKTAKKE